MRHATMLKVCAAIILVAGVASAQEPENGLMSPPYAGPLIDDTHLPVTSFTTPTAPRFTVVMVRYQAILLDAVTGNTWHLVFTETSNGLKLRWEPISRSAHASSFKKQIKRQGEALPNDDPFTPFIESTDVPRKKATSKHTEQDE